MVNSLLELCVDDGFDYFAQYTGDGNRPIAGRIFWGAFILKDRYDSSVLEAGGEVSFGKAAICQEGECIKDLKF